jgi:hypothetical protein
VHLKKPECRFGPDLAGNAKVFRGYPAFQVYEMLYNIGYGTPKRSWKASREEFSSVREGHVGGRLASPQRSGPYGQWSFYTLSSSIWRRRVFIAGIRSTAPRRGS